MSINSDRINKKRQEFKMRLMLFKSGKTIHKMTDQEIKNGLEEVERFLDKLEKKNNISVEIIFDWSKP